MESGDLRNGNDEIFLRTATGSTQNEATIQAGGGNDNVRIQGDMSLFLRVGDADVERTSPLFVLHTAIAPNLVVTTEKDGQTWIPAAS